MSEVLITGIGVVTSLGWGKDSFVDGLQRGLSGISKVTKFDTTKYRMSQAGEIKLDCQGIPLGINSLSAFLKYSLNEAIVDSGLDTTSLNKINTQIFVGTAHGALSLWEDCYKAILNKEAYNNKKALDEFPIWNIGKQVNTFLNTDLSWTTVSTACTSSTIALGLAYHAIKSGLIQNAIVIGVDELTEFIFAGFNSLRALTITKCRPFDKNRDGLVLGEGAAVLILESNASKKLNKKPAYATISGYAANSDAFHLTAPDPKGIGASLCISKVLEESHLDIQEISYINAHGTGTVYNDNMETIAYRRILKDYASSIPISSIKAHIGHTSGASGLIEVALCALSIQNSFIAPTLDFESAESSCQLNLISKTIYKDVNATLSFNAAFGGNNACVALKRCKND